MKIRQTAEQIDSAIRDGATNGATLIKDALIQSHNDGARKLEQHLREVIAHRIKAELASMGDVLWDGSRTSKSAVSARIEALESLDGLLPAAVRQVSK